MNVIVCGCGDVGSSIVSYLFREGHQVSVIDSDVDMLKKNGKRNGSSNGCRNGNFS